ncbi:MAG: histidine phosphatase family protein [Rhodospirillales bacterium]|nr:histidine phosphatase family protein [Rhodospirillales bacterium]
MIYLVRHGETEFNVARRHQGHTDSPLTELGRRQARGAARALAGLVEAQHTVIFASPLGRALTTAQIIADTIGITAPIITDADLKEVRMGSAEGMTEAEMTERWPERHPLSAVDSLSFESPDGERLEALSTRLRRVLTRVVTHDATSRILVSHGVAGRVLRMLHLDLDPADAIRLDAPHDVLFRFGAKEVKRIAFEID